MVVFGLGERVGRKLSKEKVVIRLWEGIPLRLYPTEVELPVWAGPLAVKKAVESLRINENSIEVGPARRRRKRGRRHLLRSPLAPDLEPELDAAKVKKILEERIEVDWREIVPWMLDAMANNIVLTARMAEYNSVGSEVVGRSSDGYIPGVYVEDIHFRSKRGSAVTRDGGNIAITPRGNFFVRVYKKATGVFQDLLSWGSISWVGMNQWTGTLLKWKQLIKTPLQDAIGFFRDTIGNVAPHFILQETPRPSVIANVRITISSDRRQNIHLRFRDPTNYRRVADEAKVTVDAGESEIRFSMMSFPFVPPLVAEIQPEDKTNTVLESYEAS